MHLKERRIMDFNKASNYILNKIEYETDENLFYHNLDHTLDVYQSAIKIAEKEMIGEHDLTLLKTACLYHDSGMLIDYRKHEEMSCQLARESLPGYGYSDMEIRAISAMIMSTKLPQDASSLLEKIICDADLDYLGRDDFFMIAHRLRLEWIRLGVRNFSLKEWYKGQIDFLQSHDYFTIYAKAMRNEGKERNLDMIQEICATE